MSHMHSPAADTRIRDIRALQIFDSRGNPTVYTTVELFCGAVGSAAVPSGASTGVFEAHELRDGGPAYGGKGVLRAVANVNGELRSLLAGRDAARQRLIDSLMCAADGTPDKSRLGANAILSVSLACARASANAFGLPLYRWLGGVSAGRLPVPMMNILNGGAHAGNNVDIQEFMIVPRAGSFAAVMRAASEIYAALGRLLRERGLATTVGDEGGYAPDLSDDEEALALICDAIDAAGYKADVPTRSRAGYIADSVRTNRAPAKAPALARAAASDGFGDFENHRGNGAGGPGDFENHRDDGAKWLGTAAEHNADSAEWSDNVGWHDMEAAADNTGRVNPFGEPGDCGLTAESRGLSPAEPLDAVADFTLRETAQRHDLPRRSAADETAPEAAAERFAAYCDMTAGDELPPPESAGSGDPPSERRAPDRTVSARPAVTVGIALDAAAGEWQDGGDYLLPKKKKRMTRAEVIAMFERLCGRYPIVSVEDPLGQEDFEGFAELTRRLKNVQIVGDDLFVTNTERLARGIAAGAGSAILIKPNQIGTLTETLDAVAMAKSAGFGTIISHRSGETEDTTIADIAVGLNAGQIKTGAPARSDRVAKYNRLLQIESELGQSERLDRHGQFGEQKADGGSKGERRDGDIA